MGHGPAAAPHRVSGAAPPGRPIVRRGPGGRRGATRREPAPQVHVPALRGRRTQHPPGCAGRVHGRTRCVPGRCGGLARRDLVGLRGAGHPTNWTLTPTLSLAGRGGRGRTAGARTLTPALSRAGRGSRGRTAGARTLTPTVSLPGRGGHRTRPAPLRLRSGLSRVGRGSRLLGGEAAPAPRPIGAIAMGGRGYHLAVDFERLARVARGLRVGLRRVRPFARPSVRPSVADAESRRPLSSTRFTYAPV